MNKFLFFLVLSFFLIQNQISAQATCATAVAVTVGTQQCGSSLGNVGDFPGDGSAPSNPCASLYNDDEYWFSIVGDGTNLVQVDVSSITQTYAGVFILDDCPANAPNCVTSVDNGSSTADLSVTTSAPIPTGVTYYIVISSWGIPDFTDFCLDVTLVAPPPPLANDSCQIAETLPVQQDLCTTWTTGDNTTATDSGELPAPSCGSYGGDDLWYSVTVPASGNITFDVQTPNWTSAAGSLYSGVCGALVEVDCTEFGGGWPFVFTGLTPGNYLFRAWDYGNNDFGEFDICAFTTDCSVTELAAGVQTACDPITNTYTQEIVVTYTGAPSTGTLDVNGESFTIGTSPQTVILTGLIADGADVDVSASFSGSPTCLLDSLDLFTAPANCLPPPANDACADAIPVTINSDEMCTLVTSGTTEVATESLPGCAGTANDDVWYSFVATSTIHTFDVLNVTATSGTSIDMMHEVFSGACGSLTSLECSDPNSSEVTPLVVGTTYYVRVYSYFTSSRQSFDLCIGTPPPPPPPPSNDSCQIADVLPVQQDACTTWTTGDNTSATDSGALPAPSCGSYGGGDMWFTVTVPSTGNVTFDVQNVSWTSVAASLYSGTCGTLVEENCTEFGTGWPFVFTGLTPGNYLLRTWDFGNDQIGTFDICAFSDAAACAITELAAGVQTACDPANGTYTQEITVTYSGAPTTGTLDVNGQSFPIGTSPQTVTLTGLVSTGSGVTVSAIFSDDTTCALDSTALYVAPAFCGTPSDKCGLYSSSPAKDIDGRDDLDAIDTISVSGVPALPLTDLNVVVEINHTWLEDLDIVLKSPAGTVVNLMLDKCGSNNDMNIEYDDEGGTLVCGQPTVGVFVPDAPLSAVDGEDFNGDWILCVVDDEKAADDGQLVKWCLLPQFCGLEVSLDSTDVSCNGGADGTATATATNGIAPYTYNWSNGQTSATANGLSAGTVTVTVIDSDGCTVVESIVIGEATALGITLTSTTLNCNGDADATTTAAVTGGTAPYSYAWSNGQTGATANSLGAGSYTVTATDANGCTINGSVTITEPALLTASAAMTTPASCNGGADGVATASATGGTAPYAYTWSDGQTTAGASGLSAGSYTVTVTDDNSCSSVTNVTITQPSSLGASTAVSGLISCNGGSDGSATVTATGGSTPYSYNWSNGQTSATANGLAAGTHSVTVSDANNCSVVATVTLTEPVIVSATVSVTDASCLGFSDGSATATGAGGTSPYTYQWDAAAASQTTATATGLASGTYAVTILDANNCSVSTSAVVGEGVCDFCDLATNGTLDICATILSNPNHPLATLDCDNGGILNSVECAAGTDPLEPSDDCQAAITLGVSICGILTNNPNSPLATADCDNGGVDNATECANGEDPANPNDDCDAAISAGLDICALINLDPNHPLAGQDCDSGGVDNYTECVNGGDPAEPSDDCEVAADAGLDICLIIATQPGTHPWTSLDCDNGGVANYVECINGTDPSDPIDDDGCPLEPCDQVINGSLDVCAILVSDPTHPLGTLDCDEGGVDNATECANGGDPTVASDDCSIAEGAGVDICAEIALDPAHPLASVDCDNGGVPNYLECANGSDPFEGSDDCAGAGAGINICILINYDPNHPLSSLDCDNGGVDNYTECISGEDPLVASDDCQTVIDEDIEICSIIVASNGMHPLTSLDCDNGGVDNAHECQHQTDTHDPSDDCEAVIKCNLNVCALIDGDPNHPLADQDCDGGGMSNWSECQVGSDPNNPADDCIAAMADSANICAIINYDPTHPMASSDCDNGGISNWIECQNGEDPSDPADDCNAAMDVGADICTVIIVNPTSPIATLDCDGGGVDNQTECDNGGNPTDPADDCYSTIAEGEDICAVIGGDPTHPMATLDCDAGGVDNYTECENGGDPSDPTDDCMIAKDAGVDICALIGYDPNHPMAALDCDNGGVDNYTECVDGAGDPTDPMDDCESAVIAGLDLCLMIDGDATHPWASLDCDGGGIPNLQECMDGGDPSDPIDDSSCPPTLCEEALAGTMDICVEILANPAHPSSTLDCDGGGITNAEECAAGGDPLDSSDDCMVAMAAGLDLCVIINGDPTHPMAALDCDGGGVSNLDECRTAEDPSMPTDDCQAAIANSISICQIINYEPTHPMAALDCDGGGIDNWTECQNGADPSIASDDCAVVVAEGMDICALLTSDPTNAIGEADCDGDGVTNATECADGTDPLDPCDFVQGSITLPITADQSGCINLCPDLTPITTILPGNIAGASAVGVAVEITELNNIDTDGSSIIIRVPSDPRLTFTWDPTLTSVALTPVNNANWTFLGDNGIVITLQYNGPGGIIAGGSTEAFGFETTYDPQSTDGQTTITASIIPFSGGECKITNNTDSERLVYFE